MENFEIILNAFGRFWGIVRIFVEIFDEYYIIFINFVCSAHDFYKYHVYCILIVEINVNECSQMSDKVSHIQIYG